MFQQIKILSILQLSDIFDFKDVNTTNKKLRVFGKTFASMAISYGVFVLLLYILSLLNILGSLNLFTFVILLMQVVSIVACTITLKTSLYSSKDNALLLTYPVKHSLVYVSKLVVSYIVELKKSLQLTLPLLMAYMTMTRGVFSITYVIMSVVYSLVLPLFPVLIGAILAIPVVFIGRLIKKSAIAKTLSFVLIFGALTVLTIYIIKVIPTPFNLRDMFLAFLDQMDDTFSKINKFGLYSLWFGRAMYGKNILLNNLYIVLFLIAIGVISIVSSMPLFFKMASSEGEHSVQKKHGSKNVAHNSTFNTFVRKETLLSIRNVGDFISNYIFLFLMPFVLVFLSMIYVHIDRNYIGIALTYALIGLVALLMSSVSNTASATAISSEGNEFVLLKTSPAKTINIIWAKLVINLIISTICLFISFLVVDIAIKNYVFSGIIDNPDHYYNSTYLWVVFVYTVLINIGLMMQSIKEDILNPSFKEYETSGSRTSVKSFSGSILLGLVATVIFSVIVLVCFLFFNIRVITIILISVGVLWDLICLYFLIGYSKAYFPDIQL